MNYSLSLQVTPWLLSLQVQSCLLADFKAWNEVVNVYDIRVLPHHVEFNNIWDLQIIFLHATFTECKKLWKAQTSEWWKEAAVGGFLAVSVYHEYRMQSHDEWKIRSSPMIKTCEGSVVLLNLISAVCFFFTYEGMV